MGSRHLRLRLAGIVGVWLAALLLQPAQALEFELPGERLVEIHGFYELRLRFFGEDLPANGATLSQFRHVLNLETEVDIMPEGWGPFDTMIAFTRWIASYETVYHKGIPPLAGANSYGGHYRTPSRNPKNSPTVETDPPFIAGVWRAPYQTGTVVSGVQSLGRAYRTCVNPDGVFGNPAPLSFLCNFYSRSLLGGPFGVNGDPPATGPTGIAGLTFAQPAGVINPLFTASLLSLARGSLGPEVVNDLFSRPRAGIRLDTALAGSEPGSTYCTGNPSIDPKGCSTAFTTPQDEGFAGQAFGTVRMLQAAGFQNKQGQVRAPQLGGGLDQARHLKWFPLLFDSDGGVLGRTQKVFTDPTDPDRVYRVAKQYSKLVGTKTVTVLEGSVTLDPTTPDGTLNDPMRSLGRKLTPRDLLASGQTLGQQVRRDGQLLFRLPTGAVTTNSSLAGAEPLFQPATIESEFGPAFRLFSTDPDAYEKVGALIYARLENDRFGDRGGLGNPDGHDGLAIINDSEITTSLWGATTFENSNPGVLTDLDAPIRPGGYLTVPSAEWISPSSGFLAHNLGTSVGVRRISADGFCNATNVFNLHGVPYCGITGQKPIGFPDDIQFGNQLIAGPLGPDGIEFTADDLPNFNYVKQSDPMGAGAVAREGHCELVQLTSNGDVRGSACKEINAGFLGGIVNTGACDIFGNCTPMPEAPLGFFGNLPGFPGGGGGEVRAAWDGGATIVNGQVQIPGQPDDLRGTSLDCVPGDDSTIDACNIGKCETPEFGKRQDQFKPGLQVGCLWNPDRYVQAVEAVQCELDAGIPNCGKAVDYITTDTAALDAWLALPEEDRKDQCRQLSATANKAFYVGGPLVAQPIGYNKDGFCVEVQLTAQLRLQGFPDFSGITSIQAAGLTGFFVDAAGRPAGAFELSTDLTQVDAIAQQAARPPARSIYAYSDAQGAEGNSPNGLFFMTAGQDKFIKEHSQVYSNLDLDFRESELIWEHGASQKDKEFREGYLEFEMLDSALFARVGKLLVVWGKTELVRNQDRLNPVDIGFGTFSALEESRIGVWASQVIYSPEWAMHLGPLEDVRFEAVMVWGAFEPQDLGKCGESLTFVQVCQKSFGAMANGLLGLGLVGEARPSSDYDGWKQYDYGVRIEGRWDRFTFSVSDFWGWDDTFYIEPIHTYDRRVSAVTGAPLNVSGSGQCNLRMTECKPGMKCAPELIAAKTLVPAGPDGVPNPCTFINNVETPNCPFSGHYSGDAETILSQRSIEDQIPSVGNCLLFDNPENAGDRQLIRNAAEISLNHYANLSLFHVICTLQFSPDAGYCGFDQLNTPETWHLVSDALGTGALTTFISPNSLTMQSASFPFTGFSLFSFQNAIFANAQNSSPLNLSQESAETQALLGCGPLFLSPCDSPGLAEMTTDFAFMCTWASEDSTGVTLQNPEACDPDNFVDGLPVTAPAEIRVIGGIDFMNARADVLMQDFTLIKYMEAGGYIGTALGDCPADRKFGGQCFLPGIKLPDLANPQSLAPTDYAIEGMTFPINEEWAARGVLLFKTQPEDRLDNGSDGSVPGIENCTPFPDAVKYSGGATPRRLIDPGCTVLESYSANFERLLIELEIAGGDRYFDPPESFEELMVMLDGDPSNDLQGDAYAGPDGLLSLNLDITVPPAAGSSLYTPDTFLFIQDAADFDPDNLNSDYNGARDYVKDTYAVLDQSNSLLHVLNDSIPLPDNAAGTPGRACQPTVTLPSGDEFFRGYCFQYLAPSGIPRLSETPIAAGSPFLDNGPLVAALPINLNVCPLASGCDDQADNIGIDPRVLTGEQIMALDLGQVVELTAEQNPIKNDPDLSGAITIVDGIRCANQQVDGVTRRVCGQARIGGATNVWGLKNLDLNNDFILDLDQDGDGVLDFLDNNTPGPVSDDNVLCGSGLPGDILQDVKQFDFIFENTDLQKLQERFPNNGIMNAAGEVQWLPPRSPIFCSSLVGLMSATGRTYAFKEAGGNGLVGRRSFQWHGGSQLGIFYQKRNVFGLGLDFAEDTTKSSWGLEFSWSKDSIVSNVKEPIGYNLADEYVLTVSVDRPTFINFLNPNRTFFINFQFFLNWLSSYDKEANFGARPYQLDGLVTLTFFTGYFQDRLNPRVTMIWFPMSGTYGMLTGVGYRWNERFSTSLGLNYFWGRKNLARGNYFQFLRTTPYEKSEVFRGTGAVQNRDVATMTFRYTW